MAAKIAFACYVLIVAVGSIIAVVARSLVRALLGLIMTLFGVAGMYLLMAAPLVAFMQLLIYVGAVSVLIFFAVMLVRSGPGGEEAKPAKMRQNLYAALGLLAPGVVIGGALIKRPLEAGLSRSPVEIPAAELGKGLLGPYLLAFELISIVLLVAMVGAVIIAFEKRGGAKP